MATFTFQVKSHIDNNNENFEVYVKRRGIGYSIRLKNGSKVIVDLEKKQSLDFKLKNTTKENAYMNWDNNDNTPNNRHNVGDIDQKQMDDFHKKHPNFTLSKVNNDNLSWRVTCNSKTKKNESKNKKNGEGDPHVTVTFGEDQPPTEPPDK